MKEKIYQSEARKVNIQDDGYDKAFETAVTNVEKNRKTLKRLLPTPVYRSVMSIVYSQQTHIQSLIAELFFNDHIEQDTLDLLKEDARRFEEAFKRIYDRFLSKENNDDK